MMRALFALVVASSAVPAAPVARAQTNPFDGNWNVLIACINAPDGAAGYQQNFLAQVRNGAIEGHYSNPRDGAGAILTGQIRPDGSASLKVDGSTGRPEYTIGRLQPGSPYHYTATGRFSGRSGSATRNEARRCDLTFNKT